MPEMEVFRLLPGSADYPPEQAFPSSGGRFDTGNIATLYVADDPKTAVAEYLRWNPEFLDLQDVLKIRIYRFRVGLASNEYSLATDGCGEPVGLTEVWPEPEDSDAQIRYSKPRAATRIVFAHGGSGIGYPSAAHRVDSRLCHVLFDARWEIISKPEVVEVPVVDRGSVNVLS